MDGIKIETLTENESNIIQSTVPIIVNKDSSICVIEELIAKYPEIEDKFSTIPDISNQAAFLLNMYGRGINLMCNGDHQSIFEIFERHSKYNIKIVHVECANKCILNVLINYLSNLTEEEKLNAIYPDNLDLIKTIWIKLQNNFIILMTAAYNKSESTQKISDKKAAKYRKRVFRSITIKDIDDVIEAFKIIRTSKGKSSAILARLLSTEKTILKVFHLHNINVTDQADIIFEMIDKTINQLSDIDNLVPWLRNLGIKHSKMNIAPRTLALMKSILINLFQECLGFHFSDQLKESWIRIVSFIIGMMIDGCRHGTGDRVSICSTGSADENDEGIALSQRDIDITQESWIRVQKVLEVAVESFYKDLISSKPEIRNLFARTNLESQVNRLIMAFGSIIGLLSNLDGLEPVLEELGRRHVYYHVQPKHFKYIKLAWFRMLENALTLYWTKDVKKAWNNVWKYISNIMKTSLEDALLLYTPSDPEKIKLKVLINHIDRIETQNMSYWSDIWYAAFTNDNPSQSDAFGAEAQNRERKLLTEEEFEKECKMRPEWNLTALNAMEIEEVYKENGERWCKRYKKMDSSSKNDEWFTRGNMRGTFSHAFDLHSFPFDTHTMKIKFALQIDESIATFDDRNLRVRLMPFKLDMMGGTDWNIFTPSIYISKNSAIKGGSASGKRYTHCVVDIPIARDWTHHIWDTFTPLFLIEIFAFSLYCTEINPMAKRMAVIATLLLTLFTFKITISESMPPTPYSTIMDKFFHIAKILLILHIIAQILIMRYINLNLIVGLIIFIIFILLNGYFIIFNAYPAIQKYPKKESGGEIQRALTEIGKSAKLSRYQSINTSMNTSFSPSKIIN